MRRTTACLGLLAVVLMGGPALAEPAAPSGEPREVCSADREPGAPCRPADEAEATPARAASQGDEVVAAASGFSIYAPPVRGSANVRVGGVERPGRRL